MESKICTKCKIRKPIRKFHKNRSKKDGYNYNCYECYQIYFAEWKKRTNYDRKEYFRNYTSDPKIKKHISQYMTDYRRKNPLEKKKHDARQKLNTAIRYKRMSRRPCFCGKKKSEAHHENYNKPLDVQWLCKLHHEQLHHN
jgi:hypothetical protein